MTSRNVALLSGTNIGSRPMPMAQNSSQKHDNAVMETNNSCIVSKRSVEKLYRPKEPEFIRYFVKKFQRRSPLINRGYWLRMKAIEHVVLQFLHTTTSKPKVIINLGCGYDPLPFRFLTLYSRLCQQAIFVDVDYPTLIRKKREIILNTDPLCEALDGLDTHNPQDDILIRANHYLALGCDLKQIADLTKILESQLNIRDCTVLFLAEVALTYMQPEDADSVIQWASQFNDARFCSLEQHLPSGPDHPFAQTMLNHFVKLRSPLLVLRKYPNIREQRIRFLQCGWAQADATDLWSLWNHDHFLSSGDRRALDSIEPFDEWEEFALFGGHYFLLLAATSKLDGEYKTMFPAINTHDEPAPLCQHNAKLICKTYQNTQRYRRFGATMTIEQEEKMPDLVGYHGGIGQKSRLTTCDVYTDISPWNEFSGPPTEALMNHTITYHRDSKYLLVGGRSSPDNARESCWLQDNGHWREVDSLVPGRYRHCAVQARPQPPSSRSRSRINGVLVFGGKISRGDVLGDWVFWDEQNGWQNITAPCETPEARFGASLWSASKTNASWGYVTGGMRADGTVIQDLWKWHFICKEGLQIVCQDLTKHLDGSRMKGVFGRFGAAFVRSEWGMLLLGGVTSGPPLDKELEALVFEDKSEETGEISFSRLHLDAECARPLLIGFGVASVQDHGVVILGGGATCFSFGTHWNEGCFTITNNEEINNAPWHVDERTGSSKAGVSADPNVQSRMESPKISENREGEGTTTATVLPEAARIPRLSVLSDTDFERIVTRAKPVVLEHLSIGSCTATWQPTYLKDKLGTEKAVVVHSSPSKNMNFQAKNFSYVTMPFGEFLEGVERGDKLYLRALSSKKPAKQATKLEEDYPEIAADFCLPPELGLVRSQLHSSPLRISGPVSMWLHYDVMANVLCQIRGKKRLILYPPTDVQKLKFVPGASSSEIDVLTPDLSAYPSLAETHPHEALLGPGDVLFIPAFWMHAAAPTEGMSIAVNVFFRNLDKGYAAGRDVYGNRDLEAYERGRQDINKIFQSFDQLPRDIRNFYLRRLSDEFRSRMEKTI